jgi:hypothetical protein
VRAEARILSRSRPRAATSPPRQPHLRVLAAVLAVVVAVAIVGSGTAARVLAADGCPEPNDTAEQACELRVDRTIEDELSSSNDADRFRIDVKDGQTVEVTARGDAGAPGIGLKLRIEGPDGQAVAEVGTGPGERFVLAERLPAGRYTLYLSGDGGDPGKSYPYAIKWKAITTDGPIALGSPRGSLRDLTLAASEVGEQAVQTGGRLLARDIGRVYEAVFERENAEKVRKHGPMYLLNRAHVGESVDKAQAVFDAWAISDHLPEANDGRPYGSLGDQPMPPFGDIAYAIGACTKCDDENPLRSYRVVARFDTVVYVIYSWGRDSSSNFDVVMFLANKLPRRLGRDQDPRLPNRFFEQVRSTITGV